MTEQEWNESTDPQAMLARLRDRTSFSERKAQLFAAACCSRLIRLFPNRAVRSAVEFSERDADGRGTETVRLCVDEELSAWSDSRDPLSRNSCSGRAEACAIHCIRLLIARRPIRRRRLVNDIARHAANAVLEASNDREAVERAPQKEVIQVARQTWAKAEAVYQQERRAQADLLRCVFGALPFRDVGGHPTWGPPAIVGRAQRIYDHKEFERMRELADALEEAGCADAELLGHLRAATPHARGCFALDLILGKT